MSHSSSSDDNIDDQQADVQTRWGNTDAYKQSQERTKHWTKKDYATEKEGWKNFNKLLAEAMDKGYDSPEFQDLIRHQHLSVNQFYDCSVEMFRQLGDMYVADPKFKESYDTVKPGLAECMQKAIHYYCDNQYAYAVPRNRKQNSNTA